MKKYYLKNKTKVNLIIFSFIIAFISLLICSKNSPLYPFNNWVDENAFFTVGKAWIHGILPYKDLFEQKGPLLYLIFSLSYLISNNTFIGVFILEIISFTYFLYYCGKIIDLFLKREYSYYILPLLSAVITSSIYFSYGGSAEEFCLPLLSYMLYSFLFFLKEKDISNKTLFLNGLCAGMVAMIKYTMLGFWFAFMMFIFLRFIIDKKYKKAFHSCFYFLLGMFIPIILFCLYFFFNNSLKAFIDTYILFNITRYSLEVSLLTRLKLMLFITIKHMTHNILILILLILGNVYIIFTNKIVKGTFSKVALLAVLFFGLLGTYYGCKDYPYYFLIVSAFSLFGFIYLFNEINIKHKYITILIVLVSYLAVIKTSHNIYYMKYKKEDLPQYKFASIINKKKDATLLNYGFLDGGFYMASNILPNTKYFQKQNAKMLDAYLILEKEIKDKKYDYIVVRNYPSRGFKSTYLNKNYKLIKTEYEYIKDYNNILDKMMHSKINNNVGIKKQEDTIIDNEIFRYNESKYDLYKVR